MVEGRPDGFRRLARTTGGLRDIAKGVHGRYRAIVTQGRTPLPPSSTAGRFGPAPGGENGPFSRARWKSPIRGPWLTSVFGLVLLIGIPIEFLTGLLSYAAYNPRLGNYPNPDHGLFGFYLFNGRKGRRGGGIATHPLPP